MVRLLRDIATAAAVLLLLALGLAAYLSMTTVTVRNKTDRPLSMVTIGFTGKDLWQGGLAAGDSKWVFGLPNQDGSVEITYMLGEQRHETRCGYVTGGPLRSSFEIALLPGGQSTCEQSN